MKAAALAVVIMGALIIVATAWLLIGSYRDMRSVPQPLNPVQGTSTNTSTNSVQANQPTNMKLTSTAFQNNQNLPAKYTCDGEGVNPPLQISDVPSNAKSLVLILDDPDAPSGDFVHWTV